MGAVNGVMMAGREAAPSPTLRPELELLWHERDCGRPVLCACFSRLSLWKRHSNDCFTCAVFMTWHVLPSIGLIVIGVAGMGALQMGVHKLFHGKVLPLSCSRLCPFRFAGPLPSLAFMCAPQEKAHSLDDFERLAGQV